uniref:Uncharacterized protein n=1 Tax=Physcomitrium patens TaxID=3218 RepID=A0A2K1LAK5_PHYPA|nr:hypothetical protein PHYPA_001485 [Physcomitrium patens]
MVITFLPCFKTHCSTSLKHLKRECLRHLIKFGKMHELREEFDALLQEIHKDLLELSQEQIKLLKIHGL